MASFRLNQQSNIRHDTRPLDRDDALDEVQSEINDLLPSWDQSRIETKSKILNDIEMEEGELSGEELQDINSAKSLRRNDTSDFNYSRRQPIQITIQNKDAAKLPVHIPNFIKGPYINCSYLQDLCFTLIKNNAHNTK